MPEFYRQQPTWELEALRRALPAYIQYRNEVRGHRALEGRPAMTPVLNALYAAFGQETP